MTEAARMLAFCGILAGLAGCVAKPQVVEHTRTVTVEVPVVKPLPADLTKDCPPEYRYPGHIRTGDALDRLAAIELALKACRDQLERIRERQR